MGSPKILIADDNLQNVELLEAYLGEVDCEIRTAFDGEETLAAVDEFAPDLLLLDVMMPKLSGFEVCRKLRANPATRDTLILMVTALNEAVRLRARRPGRHRRLPDQARQQGRASLPRAEPPARPAPQEPARPDARLSRRGRGGQPRLNSRPSIPRSAIPRTARVHVIPAPPPRHAQAPAGPAVLRQAPLGLRRLDRPRRGQPRAGGRGRRRQPRGAVRRARPVQPLQRHPRPPLPLGGRAAGRAFWRDRLAAAVRLRSGRPEPPARRRGRLPPRLQRGRRPLGPDGRSLRTLAGRPVHEPGPVRASRGDRSRTSPS